MYFIKNWKDMWQSYAIWLPALATFVVLNGDYMLQYNLVPDDFIPMVVLVTGFLGRVIKQPSMGTK